MWDDRQPLLACCVASREALRGAGHSGQLGVGQKPLQLGLSQPWLHGCSDKESGLLAPGLALTPGPPTARPAKREMATVCVSEYVNECPSACVFSVCVTVCMWLPALVYEYVCV